MNTAASAALKDTRPVPIKPTTVYVLQQPVGMSGEWL